MQIEERITWMERKSEFVPIRNEDEVCGGRVSFVLPTNLASFYSDSGRVCNSAVHLTLLTNLECNCRFIAHFEICRRFRAVASEAVDLSEGAVAAVHLSWCILCVDFSAFRGWV